MPSVTRERSLRADPGAVWAVVSDPARLPAWWPGIDRVEQPRARSWTAVLVSPRGKTVRADHVLVAADERRRFAWRHDVEDSPFERILKESLTELRLRPDDGGTRVSLTIDHHARGFARLGWLQLRLATARQVEGALAGLSALVEPEAG